METGERRYVCPEIEVVEMDLSYPLTVSNELNMDSSQQGEEEEDFAQKRDNSRDAWGDIW